jgi:hypothetical protein
MKTSITRFAIPVVHELTLEEYWKQRRRVAASLMKDKTDKRAARPQSLPVLKTAA